MHPVTTYREYAQLLLLVDRELRGNPYATLHEQNKSVWLNLSIVPWIKPITLTNFFLSVGMKLKPDNKRSTLQLQQRTKEVGGRGGKGRMWRGEIDETEALCIVLSIGYQWCWHQMGLLPACDRKQQRQTDSWQRCDVATAHALSGNVAQRGQTKSRDALPARPTHHP